MTEVRRFAERIVIGADGAEIAVARWPGAKGPLVCVHGLTSHSRAFAGLATELADYDVAAVDCRGRGRSSKQAPYGLEQHAADLAAVMDTLEIDTATIVGHSMGSYVAGAFYARHPQRVRRLVFVDGGFPRQLPSKVTPEDLLESTLSVFLTKMRRTFASFEEYLAYYENTPVYSDGVDAYGRVHFAYDLVYRDDVLEARVGEACVAADWRDVLDHDLVGKRLEGVAVPLLLIRALGGLTGSGDLVVTDEVTKAIAERVPHVQVAEVPDANHHTILLSVAGAQAVARLIEEFLK
ncbi:alpha/beta fold hydrolase [Plantactinospora sp. GCM10030261]|uniref:alpha/beta fold hydrolase n=1 Tax=Plantactinospora sp. GCM10030261 TaxID=3273420 RepID=UPI0036180989